MQGREGEERREGRRENERGDGVTEREEGKGKILGYMGTSKRGRGKEIMES